MASSYHTKNGRTSKRGAFINGVWHCDCEPRMPAEKFQTKNGGKNHGRWFFTCQKPQPKRCPFFLWADDAKVREEAAVLNNSRSEPDIANPPQTPRKSNVNAQPLTPYSRSKDQGDLNNARGSRDNDSQATLDFEREESYGWHSSGDEDLAELREVSTTGAHTDLETPRKSIRTAYMTSPSKRPHSDTTAAAEDIFHTPSTATKPNGLMSPIATTPRQLPQPPLASAAGGLTSEVLEILKPANLSSTVETELVQALNRHELRAQGIARGRDITRVAVQTKDKKIAELQARIAALEGERETSRVVIAHLKQDIATSPKRPRKPMGTTRSEV